MNTVSNPPLPARPLALPNLLTYARIAAVPVVVALLYWQSILDGGLWLRWVALAVFIAAGITDVLDGYFARMYGQQSSLGRMLDPIADKLLVGVLPADARRRGDHPRLVAARLRRHPLPRNPGVGAARISRRTAGQRAGVAAGEMEDHLAARRGRLPDRGRRRRQGRLRALQAGHVVITSIGLALLWLSALVTLYTGWDYMRAGVRHMID